MEHCSFWNKRKIETKKRKEAVKGNGNTQWTNQSILPNKSTQEEVSVTDHCCEVQIYIFLVAARLAGHYKGAELSRGHPFLPLLPLSLASWLRTMKHRKEMPATGATRQKWREGLRECQAGDSRCLYKRSAMLSSCWLLSHRPVSSNTFCSFSP